jgi:hypothetical protein
MRLLRPRLTILTLMVVVAIAAIVTNSFRPISRAEAERIAESRFLKLRGASRWIGRYRVQAFIEGTLETGPGGRFADGWTVVVSDPRDGVPFCQDFLSPTGKFRTSYFAPGKFYESASTDPSVKRSLRNGGQAPKEGEAGDLDHSSR